MAQGFKVTTTDVDGNTFMDNSEVSSTVPVEKKISYGFEVDRTDEDGTEYTKDGLRIAPVHDDDFDADDKRISEFLVWASCKITIPGAVPNAWKLDTPLVQIYEVPEFLTPAECDRTISIINSNLTQSGVSGGSPSTYRTSRTGHIEEVDPDWARFLDYKMAAVLGVDPRFSEGIQGVRYDKEQYFKEHCDWFDEVRYDEEEDSALEQLGQRTWTFMVYLNDVIKGGETKFRRLNRTFVPRRGSAVVWNNLYPDGHGNPFTNHEAMPILEGHKYVITKWFRSKPNPCIWETKAHEAMEVDHPSTGGFVANKEQPK